MAPRSFTASYRGCPARARSAVFRLRSRRVVVVVVLAEIRTSRLAPGPRTWPRRGPATLDRSAQLILDLLLQLRQRDDQMRGLCGSQHLSHFAKPVPIVI